MNPLGANTWIWASPLTDERLAELAPRIAAWGFDVIEMPIETIGDWNPESARELLAGLGLGATTCAVMPASRDLVSDTPETVARATDYLTACVDVARRVGSRVVAGPIYSSVGRTWRLDEAGRRSTLGRLVEGLKPLAETAARHGVTLAMEPLNRYETSLINIAAQALEVIEAVDSPGLGVSLDTFHMNIEEKSLTTAIRQAGRRLAHVQASGNDRGAPGNDHVDWRGVADALADVGYEGAICIESFTPDNQSIARAASIWRPLEPTQDAIATDGLAFLRGLLGRAPTAVAGGDR